jgi:hypothetical protein
METTENVIVVPDTIHEIAQMAWADWSKQSKGVNYAAKPYLEAMFDLTLITDKYMYDSGASVVAYFLANATSWKGETAKAVKKKLNAMLKGYYAK